MVTFSFFFGDLRILMVPNSVGGLYADLGLSAVVASATFRIHIWINMYRVSGQWLFYRIQFYLEGFFRSIVLPLAIKQSTVISGNGRLIKHILN